MDPHHSESFPGKKLDKKRPTKESHARCSRAKFLPTAALVGGGGSIAFFTVFIAYQQWKELKKQTNEIEKQTKAVEIQNKYFKKQIDGVAETDYRTRKAALIATLYDTNKAEKVPISSLRARRDAVLALLALETERRKSMGLSDVTWTVDLSKVVLNGANLKGVILSGANLSHATLSGANLGNATLSGANLSHADLSDNIDLSGAILSGANLSHADLRGGNLRGANLSQASFFKSDLSHADLSKAVLRSDLRGAVLDGAKGLSQEMIRESYWDESTIWPELFSPPTEERLQPNDFR